MSHKNNTCGFFTPEPLVKGAKPGLILEWIKLLTKAGLRSAAPGIPGMLLKGGMPSAANEVTEENFFNQQKMNNQLTIVIPGFDFVLWWWWWWLLVVGVVLPEFVGVLLTGVADLPF